MDLHHQRIEECAAIFDKKLDEYIRSHKMFDEKGELCPHKGNPDSHATMDYIMEDVEQAHDMLHMAMHRAGYKDYMKPNPHNGASMTPASSAGNPRGRVTGAYGK